MREQPIGFQYLAGRSWMNQQYKLISKNSGSTFELYDLLADPTEASNIAATNPEIVAQLTEEYETWATAVASDTEYVPPGDSVTALLSTPNNEVTGAFEVSIFFSENVTGLETSDFLITNGTIDSLTGTNSAYTLAITPIVEGLVSVQLPAGSAMDSEDRKNLASDTLDILFNTGGPIAEGTILIDDHFDDGVTTAWLSQGNTRQANHDITEADSVIRSAVNATESNSNRGIASALSFDPKANDGFSLTFVVDQVAQTPEVNGYFLGIVGDPTVFYRDTGTRNFGLTFFGTEARTNSFGGFGLNFGDNFGASGAELRLTEGDVQLESFLDGFTATISVDTLGWRIFLNGLNNPGGAPTFHSESGTWAAAGKTFQQLFGSDDTWHIVTSNQRAATGAHTTSFDRIRLTSGRVPPPQITRVIPDLDAGDLTIHWKSVEGRRYNIERSTDLKSWIGIGSVDATGPGSNFTDPDADASRARHFYRITTP